VGPQGSWALVHRTTCTTCMAATGGQTLCIGVHTQSMASRMEAVVVSRTPTAPADGCEDKDNDSDEPQRYSNPDRELATLLSSHAGSPPIFTQNQLDSALYGYSTRDKTHPTPSSLRPTSLSYGILFIADHQQRASHQTVHIFTDRCYASAVLAMGLRPCLSQVGVLSKRLNESS